ncbi:MAG: hypothetical protein OXI13_11985 [Gammaproteobacteria bacterium]|nr:hypothetical protein [Gammaproteobacteria bacterium]MYA36549.1 hypothetical protein [Gammaproteobacteria bacterium]MYA67643.1 hypothetical protein [Gammaproteobacteria bacterium]MYH46443.1 hypothetical protein [Gammaproteobacteria bacterium]MYH84759.1 hypothetical protein [Gammaproteobacteria bacterium]
MSNSTSTEFEIVQLQMDALLDNELDAKQQQAALELIRSRPDCAREFLLARSLRDVMLDMPRPELPQDLIERVYEQVESPSASWSERLQALAGEPWLRLAVPAFATLAAVAVWLQVSAPVPEEPQIAADDQYTREDLVMAIQDLNTTIQTMNEISESMRTRLGDRMTVLPVLSLPALSVDRGGDAVPDVNDPI